MSTLQRLRLNISHSLRTSPPKLDHVLPGLLAGTLGALIAPGGLGKTMLLTQIGCALATGVSILEGALTMPSSPAAKVVLFLAEESAAVMHHRIQSAVAELLRSMGEVTREQRLELAETLDANLHIYPLSGHADLAHIDTETKSFRQIVELCTGARLVVFDPLRRFHDGDENDSATMTSVVNRFQALARETNAAVILAHHANRISTASATGNLSSASRGSSALTDGVRWQANLSVPAEKRINGIIVPETEASQLVRLDISKTNYSRAPLPVLLRKNEASGALSLWPAAPGKKQKSLLRQVHPEAK